LRSHVGESLRQLFGIHVSNPTLAGPSSVTYGLHCDIFKRALPPRDTAPRGCSTNSTKTGVFPHGGPRMSATRNRMGGQQNQKTNRKTDDFRSLLPKQDSYAGTCSHRFVSCEHDAFRRKRCELLKWRRIVTFGSSAWKQFPQMPRQIAI